MNQDINNLEQIATAMALARQAALQQQRRKDQIHHYWQHGPVPPTPNVFVEHNGQRVQDFIGSVKLEHRIIELILNGAPARIFDWTVPPTAESMRHNANAPHLLQAIDPPTPKTGPHSKINDPPIWGATEYGLEALQREYDILAKTPEGERNTQANTSAFNLGQLVGSGDLPEALVVEQLWDAALRTGLPTTEIRSALRSGLESGKAKPRTR